jgi:hypothetical protein
MDAQADTDTPALLSPEQFRKRMGLSHHRTWQLLSRRVIFSFKLSGRRYIPASEIQDLPRRMLAEAGFESEVDGGAA